MPAQCQHGPIPPPPGEGGGLKVPALVGDTTSVVINQSRRSKPHPQGQPHHLGASRMPAANQVPSYSPVRAFEILCRSSGRFSHADNHAVGRRRYRRSGQGPRGRADDLHRCAEIAVQPGRSDPIKTRHPVAARCPAPPGQCLSFESAARVGVDGHALQCAAWRWRSSVFRWGTRTLMTCHTLGQFAIRSLRLFLVVVGVPVKPLYAVLLSGRSIRGYRPDGNIAMTHTLPDDRGAVLGLIRYIREADYYWHLVHRGRQLTSAGRRCGTSPGLAPDQLGQMECSPM